MTEILQSIISLAIQDDFETKITYQLVINAKDRLEKLPVTKSGLFITLSSLNLLNKALKMKDFENLITYGLIKRKVSQLAIWVLKNYQMKFDTKIYIDNDIRCIYFKICELQFSFHDVLIDNFLLEFINSKYNIAQDWNEIRLQKVAAELFLYSVNKKIS